MKPVPHPPEPSKALRVMLNFAVLCLLTIGLIQVFWNRFRKWVKLLVNKPTN